MRVRFQPSADMLHHPIESGVRGHACWKDHVSLQFVCQGHPYLLSSERITDAPFLEVDPERDSTFVGPVEDAFDVAKGAQSFRVGVPHK